MSRGQQAYREFLRSSFWKRVSKAKKESVGGRCERCGMRRGLESHHVRYPENWWDTELGDLEVLCAGCHEAEHGVDERKFLTGNDVDLDIAYERVRLIRNRDLMMESGRVLRRSEKRFLRRCLELWPGNGGLVFRVITVLADFQHPEVRYTKLEFQPMWEKATNFYVRKSI